MKVIKGTKSQEKVIRVKRKIKDSTERLMESNLHPITSGFIDVCFFFFLSFFFMNERQRRKGDGKLGAV